MAKSAIHQSIKQTLGYRESESDASVIKDWKARLSRVCKPCWELHYCPYGPFVEQSPLLPPLRADAEESINYKRECIQSGLLGAVSHLTEEEIEERKRWLQDEELLLRQASYQLDQETMSQHFDASDDPLGEFEKQFHGSLPPIEQYRVSFDLEVRTPDLSRLNKDQRRKLKEHLKGHKAHLQKVIKSGVDDYRKPLDAGRRASFAKEVEDYNPDEYPESIPQEFTDGACSIFGHICPVFFCAEAITETSRERRRGRYISFKTKIRVVRRDNYTCQHCGVHLQDDEVEFDHIIPVARGGSSEEHNIRLTCFECNREKSDKFDI